MKIVFRGDSGFCRPRMLSWCERNRVDYIVGIARNEALASKAMLVMEFAAIAHEASGKKVRVFDEFAYTAKTWRRRSRRVIVKADHAARGANPRYIVTSLKDAPERLYDRMYCTCGDMENRIKEQQIDLFTDRTSCHVWWPNQHRLLLSGSFPRQVLLQAGKIARKLTRAHQKQSRAARYPPDRNHHMLTRRENCAYMAGSVRSYNIW